MLYSSSSKGNNNSSTNNNNNNSNSNTSCNNGDDNSSSNNNSNNNKSSKNYKNYKNKNTYYNTYDATNSNNNNDDHHINYSYNQRLAPPLAIYTVPFSGIVRVPTYLSPSLSSCASWLTVLVYLHLQAYADGRNKVWDSFMDMISPLAQSVPYMVCVGNHVSQRNHLFNQRKST